MRAFQTAPACRAAEPAAFSPTLYERPDAKDGFQRGFCSSLDQAEAKVDAEMRWLSKHRYTLIEAFIIDVQDISGKRKDKK